MDPITILTIVSGVVYIVKGGVETYKLFSEFRRTRKAAAPVSKNVEKEEEKLSNALQACGPGVQKEYNQLAGKFGTMFAPKGDKTFRHEFKLIAKRQKGLLDNVKLLQGQVPNNTQDDQLIKKMQSLTVDAKYIQAAMMSALKRFSERATPIKLLEGLRTKPNLEPLEVLARPRAFCYGALLLQQSDIRVDVKALATDPTVYFLGFTCKFCNLEIGDYRMSQSGKTLISTRILARSHVTSCASFLDRRAFYKCLACYAKHGDVDFSSAEALESHLERHPRKEEQPAYLEEEDIGEELKIDEQHLNLGSAEDDEGDLVEGLDDIHQGLQLEAEAAEGVSFQDSAVSSMISPDSTMPSSNAPWASPEGMDIPSALPTDDYMNRGGVSRPETPSTYQQPGQPMQSPGNIHSQQQQFPQSPQQYQQAIPESRTNSFTSVHQQRPSPQPQPGSRQTSTSSFSPLAAQSTASVDSTRLPPRANPNMNNYDDGYGQSQKKDKEHSLFSKFGKDKRNR